MKFVFQSLEIKFHFYIFSVSFKSIILLNFIFSLLYCTHSKAKEVNQYTSLMYQVIYEDRTHCKLFTASCRTYATKYIDAGDTYSCSFNSSDFKLTCQISSDFGQSTIVNEYANLNDFIDESSCIGRNLKQKETCSGSCVVHCFTDNNNSQCGLPREIINAYSDGKKLLSTSINGYVSNKNGYEFDRVNRVVKTTPYDIFNCKSIIDKYTYYDEFLIKVNDLDISQATGQSCSSILSNPSEITYNSDKIVIKKAVKSQSADITYFTNYINNLETKTICK